MNLSLLFKASKANILISIVFAIVIALSLTSIFVGISTLSFDTENTADSLDIILISRVPRTLALILAGTSLAIAGVIMQQLARNKFVEPTTTGTVESASLGILLMLIFFPQASVIYKLLVACLFSIIGTAMFLLLLRRISFRSDFLVPLVGMMYAAVLASIITFIAYRTDLLQSIWVWMQGDFSMIIQGRYELLWLAAALAVSAYFIADKLTLAGLGKEVSTNLGLNYNRIFILGLIMVSLITGITVVNSGVIPFLGLIVPNIVSLIMGDNLRKSLPLVALTGAALVLFCDILSRVLIYPYEIPISTVMGIIGSGLFLLLLFKNARHAN
jgi:iron complex transport system permease protein